jgi:uncharacterized protein (TIGR02118 family)
MTVRLVVLYTQPEDPSDFDRYYFDTHMPLVRAVPGLRRAETGRFVAAPDGGEQTYYRVAELHFADLGALEAGLGSDEGKRTAADFQKIAPPGSRMLIEALDLTGSATGSCHLVGPCAARQTGQVVTPEETRPSVSDHFLLWQRRGGVPGICRRS